MSRRDLPCFVLVLAIWVVGCARTPKTDTVEVDPSAYQSFSLPRVIHVNQSMVNIRAEAGIGSKILKVARRGKAFTAIGEKGSWYHIQLDPGRQAWVSKKVADRVEPGKEGKEPGPDLSKTVMDAAPPPQVPPQGWGKVQNKWALVVGVAKFQDGRIRPLKYSDDDAEAMYRFLIDPNLGRFKPENIIKLINKQATTKNIKKAIDTIARNAELNDLVVIYVSTHGTLGKYDIADVGYLVTYDTEVDSLYATAYEMTDLTESITKRIKSNQVAAFMDTCYSAGSFKGENPLTLSGAKDLVLDGIGISEEFIERMSRNRGRILITSSRQDERSWESNTLKHGYFTYYLIDALKQNNGYVTIDKVYRHLKEKIPVEVKKDKNKPQHPVMGSNVTEGNISIGVPPSMP